MNEGAIGTPGNLQAIPLTINSLKACQVDTRGKSYYSVAKQSSGTFLICMVGLSNDAESHIFLHDGFTMETDCSLLRQISTNAEPQQCLYSATQNWYIRVDAGALNRIGTGFYLVVIYDE